MSNIINGVIQENNCYGCPLTVKILPKRNEYSTYEIVNKQFITIHETGNTNKGANAILHNTYLKNLPENNFKSWEFSVDSNQIVQNLPVNIPTYHSGSKKGNYDSIGIEICVNSDGDFQKAKNNAIKLIAYLLYYSKGLIPKINTDNLKATITGHFEWYDKQCPATILKEAGGFIKYQDEIIKFVLEKNINSVETNVDKIIADLKIQLENQINLTEKYKKQIEPLLIANTELNQYKTDLLNIVNTIKKY